MKKKTGDAALTLHPRHLGPEHLEGDDVDEHDPDGRVQHLHLVLDEGDGGYALQAQYAAAD